MLLSLARSQSVTCRWPESSLVAELGYPGEQARQHLSSTEGDQISSIFNNPACLQQQASMGSSLNVLPLFSNINLRFGAFLQYFEAAVLVEPSHAASWHAWGMLEKREGNFVKARDIWIKVSLSGSFHPVGPLCTSCKSENVLLQSSPLAHLSHIQTHTICRHPGGVQLAKGCYDAS